MRLRQYPDRAFTLVELLVVVAIVALLLAILTPALKKARSAAEATICGANQRQIYMAARQFAADNNGHGPGGGHNGKGSVSWPNVLNHEYFEPYTGKNRLNRTGIIPGEDSLMCPSLQEWPNANGSRRTLAWNSSMLGGAKDTDGDKIPDEMTRGGRLLSPPNWCSRYYYLGARFDMFKRPGQTILMAESRDPGQDATRARGGGIQILNGNDFPDMPPWTAHTGNPNRAWWSYRHDLNANFLFIDGHVERLSYKVNVNRGELYSMN